MFIYSSNLASHSLRLTLLWNLSGTDMKGRSSHWRCFVKKDVHLEISQNSQENTCARVSVLIKLRRAQTSNLIKKETLVQVISCEFSKISKNTFFAEHLWTTSSGRDYHSYNSQLEKQVATDFFSDDINSLKFS